MHTETLEHSPLFLAESSPFYRRPRWSFRRRPHSFFERFESRALFYDCFRHHDGARVLLVGPPPGNLKPVYRAARFDAGDTELEPRFHASLSVMLTELGPVSPGVTELGVEIAGARHSLPIRPGLGHRLRGRKVLTGMNRNNDPAWIAYWARHHVRHHGVDTLVLIDNGSTNLGMSDLPGLLSQTGLADLVLLSWPYAFGATDPAVRLNPYWSHFLQIAGFSLALRRIAPLAAGLLNCDIDELAAPAPGSIFDALDKTPGGLLVMPGQWIETAPARPSLPDHRAFGLRHVDPQRRLCRPGKWALDPRRDWVDDLSVHPYWHWIEGRPRAAKSMAETHFYWHFKAINTAWKSGRASAAPPPAAMLEPDPLFARLATEPGEAA